MVLGLDLLDQLHIPLLVTVTTIEEANSSFRS
jgi:hypothetical protein